MSLSRTLGLGRRKWTRSAAHIRYTSPVVALSALLRAQLPAKASKIPLLLGIRN